MSTQKSHLPDICFFAIACALRPLGLVPRWGSLMNQFARPTLVPYSYNSAWPVGHITAWALRLNQAAGCTLELNRFNSSLNKPGKDHPKGWSFRSDYSYKFSTNLEYGGEYSLWKVTESIAKKPSPPKLSNLQAIPSCPNSYFMLPLWLQISS